MSPATRSVLCPGCQFPRISQAACIDTGLALYVSSMTVQSPIRARSAPSGDGLEQSKCCGDLVVVHADLAGNRDRGQGGGEVVSSDGRQTEVRVTDSKPQPFVLGHHVGGDDVVVRLFSDPDDGASGPGGQAQDPVVVSVDDGESRRRESFEEFSLRCTDIVDGAEFVEMSWCDSCDDADFRPGNGCQPADLADAGRGQFEHGELIVGRDAEQTQRDSEVIVEVLRALRAGEPAGEHRVNHVSCGRLADAAGHPDGDRVHLFAVPGGELSEGGGGVADFDQQSVMVDVSSRFDDAGGCPIGKGLRDKVVTVVPFAFECPEQITAFHLPGVGLDTVEAVFRKVVAGSHAGSGGGDKLLKRHRWHSLARCRRNIRLGGCLVRPVQVHEPVRTRMSCSRCSIRDRVN